jgi:dihydrofolate reductase
MGNVLPVFVVIHRPQKTLVTEATTFTFVTGCAGAALAQARAAAGDKDVSVGGGASVI